MIDALPGPWIGHLFLDFGAASQPAKTMAGEFAVPHDGQESNSSSVRLNLSQHSQQWKPWARAGGHLALQAIAPLAALPRSARQSLRFLVAGPGADLCTMAGQAIGCQSVIDLSEVDSGQTFHRVFLGCAQQIPNHHDVKSMLNHLRQEGQLVLYGLPAADLATVHQALAKQGFALRAAGKEGTLAFLSGSIEDPHSFKSRPGALA
jgi:hypothetical protein